MKPEQAMWESLRPQLQALGLDPQRTENVVGAGTPDVSYTKGHIELKALPRWPKDPYSVVTVQGLIDRPAQVPWLMRRWKAGGPCWLMLRGGNETLLFSGWDSRLVRLGLPLPDLKVLSVWDSHQDLETLRQWLLWDTDAMTTPNRAKLMRLKCCKTVEEVATDMGVAVSFVRSGEVHDGQAASDLVEYWTV